MACKELMFKALLDNMGLVVVSVQQSYLDRGFRRIARLWHVDHLTHTRLRETNFEEGYQG